MASRDSKAREGDISKALRLKTQDSHPNLELWEGEEGGQESQVCETPTAS